MSATERPLVVGVDESSGTEAALRWAAEDAQARSAPVRLVCAYRHEIGTAEAPFFLDGPDVALDEPRQIADRLVTEAIDRVTALYPRAEASGEAIAGD
ncbi:MAG TPA: universal stress protein, partial [Jatrophihabitantaceae bacterium]|nr:universal stress protein [Jatrophihabitantaceae bacterium]